jgi:hypothetical protein
MLFGSGVLFAFLLPGNLWPAVAPPTGLLALRQPPAVSTRAPAPAINLRYAPPQPTTLDMKSLNSEVKAMIGKAPVEVKSVKVVGASGFGVFVPLTDTVSIGAAVTAFKIGPHERATQAVAAIRFRF